MKQKNEPWLGSHQAKPGTDEPGLVAAREVIISQVAWDDEGQAVMGAMAWALLDAYHRKWHGEQWRAVQIEATQQAPVMNPDTGHASRTFTHAGKIDGRVVGYGRQMLLEHKTTSDEISSDDAPFWRRLSIDSQISKYLVQCLQHGIDLDGCLYDVVKKPNTKPKLLTSAQARQATSLNEYLGQHVPDEVAKDVVDQVAANGRAREPLALYAIRLKQILAGDPDAYLVRRCVYRIDSELHEHLREIWAMATDVRAERRRGLWPRSTHACWQWNTPCAFLGICSGHDDADGVKWQRKDQVHQELDELETEVGGRDVITNSSLNTFLACRRKYLHKYEQGLQRVQADEQRNDALYFGTLWHMAQEAWWQHTMEGNESDGEGSNI